MTTGPSGSTPGEHADLHDELERRPWLADVPASPFGAVPPSPFGASAASAAEEVDASLFAGAPASPLGGIPASPFGVVPAPAPATWESTALQQPEPTPDVAPMAPFGTSATTVRTPAAVVPAPRTAVEDAVVDAALPGALAAPARTRSRRVSPVLALAVAGGAVLAGALGAFALLGTGDGDASATTAVPAPVSTAAPTDAPPAAGDGAAPQEAPGTGTGGAFEPNARDPFAALVTGGAAGQPASGAAGAPVVSGGGVTDPLAGALPGTSGPDSGTGQLPVGVGGSTGGSGQTGSGGAGQGAVATPTPSPTQLSKAQVCTTVADPMDQVEAVLTSSAGGTVTAVDAGLALRAPVAVLRTAVSLSADSRLASRLDIAASTAEALRAQLIAGTPATTGQVSTQVARDADVRAACA